MIQNSFDKSRFVRSVFVSANYSSVRYSIMLYLIDAYAFIRYNKYFQPNLNWEINRDMNNCLRYIQYISNFSKNVWNIKIIHCYNLYFELILSQILLLRNIWYKTIWFMTLLIFKKLFNHHEGMKILRLIQREWNPKRK